MILKLVEKFFRNFATFLKLLRLRCRAKTMEDLGKRFMENFVYLLEKFSLRLLNHIV